MLDLDDRSRPTVPDRGLLTVSALGFGGFLALLVLVCLQHRIDPLDAEVAARIIRERGPAATALARSATALGSLPVVVAVAVATVAGVWSRTRRLWVPAIVASAMVTTASLVTLMKIAVARSRPDVSTLIGGPATDYAFPSGHTTNGSLVYVLAALFLTAPLRCRWRRLAVAFACTIALLIGWSRVYLGYHWATDVLAGWLFALGVTAASSFTTRRLGTTAGAPRVMVS